MLLLLLLLFEVQLSSFSSPPQGAALPLPPSGPKAPGSSRRSVVPLSRRSGRQRGGRGQRNDNAGAPRHRRGHRLGEHPDFVTAGLLRQPRLLAGDGGVQAGHREAVTGRREAEGRAGAARVDQEIGESRSSGPSGVRVAAALGPQQHHRQQQDGAGRAVPRTPRGVITHGVRADRDIVFAGSQCSAFPSAPAAAPLAGLWRTRPRCRRVCRWRRRRGQAWAPAATAARRSPVPGRAHRGPGRLAGHRQREAAAARAPAIGRVWHGAPAAAAVGRGQRRCGPATAAQARPGRQRRRLRLAAAAASGTAAWRVRGPGPAGAARGPCRCREVAAARGPAIGRDGRGAPTGAARRPRRWREAAAAYVPAIGRLTCTIGGASPMGSPLAIPAYMMFMVRELI